MHYKKLKKKHEPKKNILTYLKHGFKNNEWIMQWFVFRYCFSNHEYTLAILNPGFLLIESEKKL